MAYWYCFWAIYYCAATINFFEGGGVGVRGKRLLYIVEGTEVQVPGMSYVCGMLVFLVCLINKWCLTAGSWVGAGV